MTGFRHQGDARQRLPLRQGSGAVAVRGDRRPRELDESSVLVVRGLGQGRVIAPESQVRLVHHQFGVGKQRRPGAVNQPADMVRMQMRRQHRVDIAGLHAQRPQVAGERAEARPHRRPATAVHQHQPVVGLQQEATDGDPRRNRAKTGGVQRRGLVGWNMGQVGEGGLECAIVQRGDGHVADRVVIDAGGLAGRAGRLGHSGPPAVSAWLAACQATASEATAVHNPGSQGRRWLLEDRPCKPPSPR